MIRPLQLFLFSCFLCNRINIIFIAKESNKPSFQNLTVSDVKVFINVVRALDIPIRDDVQPAG